MARHHGLRIRRTRLLSDINFGIFSNMVAAEARAKDPGLWQQWRAAPHAVRFPAGESLGDLRQRMFRFFDEARTWGGYTVLAVTHDSPIRVAACIATGLDDSHHHEWVAETASMTIVELSSSQVRLVQPYADTKHLLGIDAA
jgi:broad specificity phosphatase PhoE